MLLRLCVLLALVTACGDDSSPFTDASTDASTDAAIDVPVDADEACTGDSRTGVSASLDELDCLFESVVLPTNPIVCSGEDSHGVAEASRVHGALARTLVHEHGVRVIALEFDRAAVAYWDSFVQTGDETALAAGFSSARGTLIDDESFEEMLRELRTLAETLPADDRLTVTGFDVAVNVEPTEVAVRDFVSRALPDEADEWLAQLDDSPADTARALFEEVDARRDELVEATDENAVLDALMDLDNLDTGLRFREYFSDGEFALGNATYRENGMTRNARRIIARWPTSGVMFISHNGHCAPDLAVGETEEGFLTLAVGTHLANGEEQERLWVLSQVYASSGTERLPDGSVAPVFGGAFGDELLDGRDGALFVVSNEYEGVDMRERRAGRQGEFIPADRAHAWVALANVNATTPR